MQKYLLLFIYYIIILMINEVFSTIDINLSELQYLAVHLNPYECRRLAAALHYTSYDLPKDISAAVRKVSDDVPCLQHLLHWNNSPAEGKGKTHLALELRLRQLNHHDLAEWLGKTVFKSLGEDVLRSINNAFGPMGEIENDTYNQYPITIEPDAEEPEEDSIWHQVDSLLLILLIALSAGVLLLILGIIIHYTKWYLFKKRKQSVALNTCDQSTCIYRKNSDVKTAVGKCTKRQDKNEDNVLKNVDMYGEEKKLLDWQTDATSTETSEIEEQTDD